MTKNKTVPRAPRGVREEVVLSVLRQAARRKEALTTREIAAEADLRHVSQVQQIIGRLLLAKRIVRVRSLVWAETWAVAE